MLGEPAPWPFALRPYPDELLTSWLQRVAREHAFRPTEFAALHFPHMPIWNRDADRNAPAELLCAMARAGSLSSADVAAMTLRPWMATLAGGPVRTPDRGPAPFILAAGVYHRTRTLHGLQYCPSCLAEGEPWYRRSWRLAFVIACGRHQDSLRDGCPHCDAPIIPHRAPPKRMESCHACERDLRQVAEQGSPSEEALRIQQRLTSLLLRDVGSAPLEPEGGFRTGRILLALLAPTDKHQRLREFLLLPAPANLPRGQFEEQRTADRAIGLETLARWIDNWPETFVAGAAVMPVTRQTLVRQGNLGPIGILLKQLRPGAPRKRQPWKSEIEDAHLRRLRRRDPAAARALREERLVAAAMRRLRT